MGLSYEDACRLGIGHEHPDHPSRRVDAPRVAAPTEAPRRERQRIPTKNAKGQNKTEARFDAILADLLHRNEIGSYQFEPVKLRLAGNTTYKPDFFVVLRDYSVAFVEVKGYMRDDAAVKVKVAAEQRPWAVFFVAFADGRGFDVRPVTRSGIGRRSVREWWRAEK